MKLLSRRHLVFGSLSVFAASHSAWAQYDDIDPALPQLSDEERKLFFGQEPPPVEEEQYFDPDLLPPPESEIDYPVPEINPRQIKKQFRRQTIEFEGTEDPGTIVVDPDHRYLYQVLAYGYATRYGVGVGRAGFAWRGAAKVGMKRRWPRWVPPREMVDRDPRARQWVNGQPGGPENPLGARALYLYADGKDTLYRIHGTNEPSSIGKAMSSGCIRMLNQDVADLFDKVQVGTPVIVRPSKGA